MFTKLVVYMLHNFPIINLWGKYHRWNGVLFCHFVHYRQIKLHNYQSTLHHTAVWNWTCTTEVLPKLGWPTENLWVTWFAISKCLNLAGQKKTLRVTWFAISKCKIAPGLPESAGWLCCPSLRWWWSSGQSRSPLAPSRLLLGQGRSISGTEDLIWGSPCDCSAWWSLLYIFTINMAFPI